MIKTSDFIHHNGSIPDFDYKMLNSNCKVVAIFKDTGDGSGFEKFQETSFNDVMEFLGNITGMLTAFKFSKFDMVGYIILHDYVKVLFFKNPITKVEIRVALCGFKVDLIDLKALYDEPV